jgi:N-carbamoylputrescine amidase
VAVGSADQSEVVIGDANLDMVREVRNLWQFFRDRRPESYGRLTDL